MSLLDPYFPEDEPLDKILADDYAGPAVLDLLEEMSPEESFGFASALGQIEKAASRAVQSPVLGQVAATALPMAGTLVGGPVGGTLGASAAKALTGSPPAAKAAPASSAAARGLVLTQQPDVLKSLLALAMGQAAQRPVGGVPVPDVMRLLSTLFGQAAADAEALDMDAEAYTGDLLETDDDYLMGGDQWP